MMRIFVNGSAASAGGGLTYLRNVIPEFARRSEIVATVLSSPELRSEFSALPSISWMDAPTPGNSPYRFFREQVSVPALIRRSGSQVLLSISNFALWTSPVPQILLSRNALYTSRDFISDLISRRDYALWADTRIKAWLARRSICQAERTVAPSEAFARELREWSSREVLTIPHGFNADAFTADAAPLPKSAQEDLDRGQNALRLLFVSHYNYYRNFETLFHAIPLLKRRLDGRKLKLYLTCHLDAQDNPGSYKANAAASLVHDLGIADDVVELGSVAYRSLHYLYRACHIYVTSAYAESFGHPLVEAMSTGLPVVASDLPVHREICGPAACYFSRFSPEELAECILRVHSDQALSERMSQSGRVRSRDFSWAEHVTRLIEVANQLLAGGPKPARG